MKRYLLPVLTALLLMMSVFAVSVSASEGEEVRIGVAINSTTDASGSIIKRIIDDAAAYFGIQILYVDHGRQEQYVVSAVEQLCLVGCKGIILCGTTDEQVGEAIRICDENHVYLAEFFHAVSENDSPEIYAEAESSPYYIGSVSDDLYLTGKALADAALNDGARHIGLLAKASDDAGCAAVVKGIRQTIDGWNSYHPEDMAEMYEPVYAGTAAVLTDAAVKEMAANRPRLDGLIPIRCGTDGMNGVLTGLEAAGIKGRISLSTDLLFPSNTALLNSGTVCGGTGDNYCNPLYAFMMVRNAVAGKEPSFKGKLTEIVCQPLSASSQEELADFAALFQTGLPYDTEMLHKMGKMSAKELKKEAEAFALTPTE